MNKLFEQAVVYDEPKEIGTRDEVNVCDVAFVCVSTPEGVDGTCDTSIVEDVLGWLDTDVIILRSTVPIGFTEKMCVKTGKSIVFQPEYCGETSDHPYADLSKRAWITLGGNLDDVENCSVSCSRRKSTTHWIRHSRDMSR